MAEEQKTKSTIYFAYGSNINIEQMKQRCRFAKIIGKGMLDGHRLFFKGRAAGAYATIEEKEGAGVPVLIWKLEPEDEKALDYYEGYPSFYEKKTAEAVLENGNKIHGMVYVMTDGMIDRLDPNIPAERYLKTIEQGYAMCGFELEYIQRALEDTRQMIIQKT